MNVYLMISRFSLVLFAFSPRSPSSRLEGNDFPMQWLANHPPHHLPHLPDANDI